MSRTKLVHDHEGGGVREVAEAPPLESRPTLAGEAYELFRDCDGVDAMLPGVVQDSRMRVILERTRVFDSPTEEHWQACAKALEMLEVQHGTD